MCDDLASPNFHPCPHARRKSAKGGRAALISGFFRQIADFTI
jgi:hypothetical protein